MKRRIEALRELMREKNMEGAFVYMPENRRYFSGFTGSAGYLVITLEKQYFIADFRYVQQVSNQSPDFEVLLMNGDTPWHDHVKALGLKTIGIEEGYMSVIVFDKLKEILPSATFINMGNDITGIRSLKDPQEIEDIKTAANIADKAFNHILGFIKPGLTEKEVQLELDFFMRKLGASGTSFAMIVASGVRSSLPHGVASEKIIEQGDFLTLDYGCIYNGYCSDMTRTLVVGKASDRQKELYNIVLEAQLAAFQLMKPGSKTSDIDQLARNVIVQKGYGDFFGHGLGHGVGLEIHELPMLNPRGTAILEPNMVVTNEPGVYIPDFGGVRIEDLILITEDGYEILSHSPKNLIELEF